MKRQSKKLLEGIFVVTKNKKETIKKYCNALHEILFNPQNKYAESIKCANMQNKRPHFLLSSLFQRIYQLLTL